MPFRHVPRLAAPCLRRTGAGFSFPPLKLRPFHSSRALRQDDIDAAVRSHYDTLNVRPDASPAEIKRSFFRLCKSHHPDHNPSDPGAPDRFMRISAAYKVLSSPEKRAAYDHQQASLHHHRFRYGGGGAHGPAQKGTSYHSTGPAGGRPASGLSRRRGTFTGPPPSFYRNGGWGAHEAKRSAAHEESTSGSGSGSGEHYHYHYHHHYQHSSATSASAGAGAGADAAGQGANPGMGPGDGRRAEDVPHFDRAAHERTHERIARRRAYAAAEEAGLGSSSEPGAVARFLLVSAIVLLGMLAPMSIISRMQQPSDSKNNKKRRSEKVASSS